MKENNIRQLKNSTLLKELTRRIKQKQIRFNYDSLYPPQNINALVSWNVLDKYDLDFGELEKFLENEMQ